MSKQATKEPQMQTLTVFGPNLRDQSKGTFVVHAKGCGDCRKLRGETAWDIDAASINEVVLEVYPPSDFDYDPAVELADYRADFHIAPCVKVPVEIEPLPVVVGVTPLAERGDVPIDFSTTAGCTEA